MLFVLEYHTALWPCAFGAACWWIFFRKKDTRDSYRVISHSTISSSFFKPQRPILTRFKPFTTDLEQDQRPFHLVDSDAFFKPQGFLFDLMVFGSSNGKYACTPVDMTNTFIVHIYIYQIIYSKEPQGTEDIALPKLRVVSNLILETKTMITISTLACLHYFFWSWSGQKFECFTNPWKISTQTTGFFSPPPFTVSDQTIG